MTSPTEIRESETLRNLRQVSEARGLRFYYDPPREIVPKFLGNYRPDALIVGPEGGIVIEVKARKSDSSDRQLSEIAKRVSREKGWEFRAIFLNQRSQQRPIINKPEPRQIEAALGEIRSLAAEGHRSAAFVLAFGTLESLARLVSTNPEAQLPSSSSLAAIQTLAEQGYLENDSADLLREMVGLRSRIVHGDLSVDLETIQIERLLEELRKISADVMAS